MSNRSDGTALLLILLMLAPSIILASTSFHHDSYLAVESTDSPTSSSAVPQPPILVDGLPPLYCSNGEICPTPVRLPDIPADSWTHEEHQWWFRYGPDDDWNGMDDCLLVCFDTSLDIPDCSNSLIQSSCSFYLPANKTTLILMVLYNFGWAFDE